MLDTLFAKTFVILGAQLLITWGITVLVIKYVKHLYYAKTPGITGITTDEGELDLNISPKLLRPYFYPLLVIDAILFVVLLFVGRNDLLIGIPVFTAWSGLTGILLGLVLITVNENLGGKVLAITASVTFLCAIVGIYSGLDFGSLSMLLGISLLLLIIANIVRLLTSIPKVAHKILASLGVIIFTGYLLFDINQLAKLSEYSDANRWDIAMDLAISLYLDILNLFLHLVDLLT